MAIAQDSSAFVSDSRLISRLENLSRPIACSPEQALFQQGDAPHGIYVVKKGAAMLTLRSKGEIVMCLCAGAGSVLGLPAVVANGPYTMTAEVLPGTEVNFVPREDFGALVRSEPEWMLYVLQVLAAEVRSARKALSAR